MLPPSGEFRHRPDTAYSFLRPSILDVGVPFYGYTKLTSAACSDPLRFSLAEPAVLPSLEVPTSPEPSPGGFFLKLCKLPLSWDPLSDSTNARVLRNAAPLELMDPVIQAAGKNPKDGGERSGFGDLPVINPLHLLGLCFLS